MLKVGSLSSTTANPANVPCADDAKTAAQVTLNSGLVKVETKVLTASTDLTPDNQNTAPANGDNAKAGALVEYTKITVGAVTVEVGLVSSSASATCVAGAPAFSGASAIAWLKVNGVPVVVGSAPLTVPLAVGSLKLNSTATTSTSVTQTALLLDTLLTDVVISQAHADIEGTAAHPSGNPCVV